MVGCACAFVTILVVFAIVLAINWIKTRDALGMNPPPHHNSNYGFSFVWLIMYHFSLNESHFMFPGRVVSGLGASLEELDQQGRLLGQIRREMATTREFVNRIYQNSTSAERLATASPILPPLGEIEMGTASSPNLAEAEGASFQGATYSLRRSAGDLIHLGSVRSVRSNRAPCSLPLDNTFTTTRM